MNVSSILKIAMGIFAGYCCCYFIADKLAEGMTPGEVVAKYFEALEEKLRR